MAEKIAKLDVPGMALEGLALAPLLGGAIRVAPGVVTVAQLASTGQKLAKGAIEAAPAVANSGQAGSTAAELAKAAVKTNTRWSAPLDVQKIVSANRGAKVDIEAVKRGMSLLEKLANALHKHSAPLDVVPKLLEHVVETREALLAGSFENSKLSAGINRAQEYLVGRMTKPASLENIEPNVGEALMGLLTKAQRDLSEMTFLTGRVPKS